jgi:ribosomal protein S18 acetylase RimI-like enzyme
MVKVAPMTLAHHAEVLALMQTSPGVVVRAADSLEATRRYLARNPGISQVALDQHGVVIGLIMGGHDGRRGYLNHVLVHPAHRGCGLARRLVEACLAALAAEGIHKVHLDVLNDNVRAKAFWQHMGWQLRDDLIRFSLINGAGANA